MDATHTCLYSYIRILEARIKRLEGYIRAVSNSYIFIWWLIQGSFNNRSQQLYPDEEVDYIISKPPPYSEGRGPRPVLSDPVHSSASFIPSKEESSAERPEDFPEISEADDISHVILAKQLERISLTPTAANRFFGQARWVRVLENTNRRINCKQPDYGCSTSFDIEKPTYRCPWYRIGS